MGLLCVFERRRPGADFLRARLQDARYVIDTITFFAVSCPENPALFRKNRQNFENIPRKILHILNILEKCCILEKSRKNWLNLVIIQQDSCKICEILGKKQQKIQQFLKKILRLENGAKECIV